MWPGLKQRERGARAEKLARRYLEQQGLQFLLANYHCRMGEIDLIMRHDETLVFIEVRYRGNDRFGSAAETVDRTKQRKLVATALCYLQSKPKLAKLASRFDVIAISGNGPSPTIDWYPDAIQVQDPTS